MDKELDPEYLFNSCSRMLSTSLFSCIMTKTSFSIKKKMFIEVIKVVTVALARFDFDIPYPITGGYSLISGLLWL